jgi:hypothetical protein
MHGEGVEIEIKFYVNGNWKAGTTPRANALKVKEQERAIEAVVVRICGMCMYRAIPLCVCPGPPGLLRRAK